MKKDKKVKQKAPKPRPKEKPKTALLFGKKNYLWFGIGIIVIIIGYIALGMGDITLAPILLVAGYCVIIPISILIGIKKGKTEQSPEKK
ncbi:MAG: hypothetical protein AMJ90_08605 [candidate division Zixibacteria bacterium SM23_73_2]|nr:MAG: hypothetical protein AMJ90_08605 [candidate division Zixibacteria bacterium SM23_73_2]